MTKERMDSMATFMHHGGHITHLPGGIHEYKRRTCFRQRTVVTSGRLAFPAVKVQPSHFLHFHEALTKEWMHLVEAGDGLVHQFFSIDKRRQGLYAFRFCIGIPWT